MDAERARVLVVDDERFFREAIGDVLEPRAEDCVFAATGAEALEGAEDPAVGVVVLDVNLPDMSGLEVFRALQERRPELRVIVLSAQTDQETVLEALRLGAFDYLAKPLHEEELALAVSRARETFGIAAGWSRLRARLRTLESVLAGLGEAARRAPAAEPEEVPAAARRRALARAAVEAAAGLLRAERASLLLRAPAGGLELAAAHGFEPGAGKEGGEPPVGASLAEGVLERGEPLLAEDAPAEAVRGAGAPKGRYRTGACALAPVPGVGDGPAAGVLCAADPAGEEAFGEEDLALLRILAGQLAPHLAASAEPAEEAGAAPEEAAAAEEAGSLEAELARAVCDATTGFVEPARLLGEALRPVGQLLGAAPVALHLLDPDGRLVRESEWDGGRRSDRARLPTGRGLTGAVLETGAVVATDAPGADPRFDPEVDTPEDGGSGPLLCGPLRFRGRVLGCFRAFPEKPERAAPALAESLASALSAAVRSVLLYRSLVDATEELARARREAAASGPSRRVP